MSVTIHLADARTVNTFEQTVDAAVTSPPYASARKDIAHVPPERYARWIIGALANIREALKPEGSLMLNLGRVFVDGEESDYHHQVLENAKATGLYHLDTIVWRKTNPPGRGGRYLTNAHEYVYWLGRSKNAYRGFDSVRTPYAPETLARYQRKWTNHASAKNGRGRPESGRTPHPLGAKPTSVFECTIGREKGNPHPTPMAMELARHLVKLSCPPGGTVLDPFMGSGNTGMAALESGRSFIGIDNDPRWVELATDRLNRYLPVEERTE